MIASVVATLDIGDDDVPGVIEEITRIPYVQIGDVGTQLRLPITIDAPTPNALEETTRRLQGCRGVAFVDVVFVYFEEESGRPSAT